MSMEVVSGCNADCSHQHINTTAVTQASESMSPTNINKMNYRHSPENILYPTKPIQKQVEVWTYVNLVFVERA